MRATAFFLGKTPAGEDVFVRRQVERSWSEPGWWLVTRSSQNHATVWSPSAGWSLPGDAPADTRFDSADAAALRAKELCQ
jgi:hypothetical protein